MHFTIFMHQIQDWNLIWILKLNQKIDLYILPVNSALFSEGAAKGRGNWMINGGQESSKEPEIWQLLHMLGATAPVISHWHIFDRARFAVVVVAFDTLQLFVSKQTLNTF